MSKLLLEADAAATTPRRVDYDALKRIGHELLVALGHNPLEDPGLKETPKRFADAWREFIEYSPGTINTVFDAPGCDEMVIVKGVAVQSFCEHHLLPFDASVTMAYIPRGRVLGLSKFGRIAHLHAHKLQLQERLVDEIARSIEDVTQSPDVAVYACGRHSCMSRRGVRTAAEMVTTVLRGRFKHDQAMRAEFMQLVRAA